MRPLPRLPRLALGVALRVASLSVALGACGGDSEDEHHGGTAPSDAGMAPSDAGIALSDAGMAPSDAGTAYSDAGTAPSDAGTATDDASVDPSITTDAASEPVTEPTIAPAFTQLPVDQQVTEGTAAVFSATVVGDPAPTLQWQRSNDDGASWTDIAGATSASYDTGAVTMADHGARFRLVAKSSAGSATTSAARVSVTAAADATAPVFDEHPVYTVVGAGGPAHFSATATGTPSPSYQWQVSNDGGTSWSDIVGASGSSYEIQATAAADDESVFRVIASNSAGSTTSSAATLVVCLSGPVTVTHDPSFWDYNQFQRGTGGIFCPRSGPTVEPHPGIPGAIHVHSLVETGMSSTQEALAITYDPATGDVIDLTYSLVTATITSTWLCSVGSSYYKPCQGVAVDALAGHITLTDTVVGEEAGNFAIVLNGALSFPVP